MVRSTPRAPNRETIIPPADEAPPSTGTAVARPAQTSVGGVNERNAFEAYGDQFAGRFIVGQLLKFNKGDWLCGEDDEEIEEGTEYTCNMNQLMIGWIKWVDNKPAEQLMGPLASGFRPARREELGDSDEEQWEVDDQGKARDPWQYSNYLLLKTPGDQAEEEQLFTFATSSKGGLGMMGDLCKVYGKEMRTRPDEWPIVAVGVRKYKHSNPEFGWIKVPTMKVVGWEEKSLFEYTPSDPADAGDEGEEAGEEAEAQAEEAPVRAARPNQRAATPAQRAAAPAKKNGGTARRR